MVRDTRAPANFYFGNKRSSMPMRRITDLVFSIKGESTAVRYKILYVCSHFNLFTIGFIIYRYLLLSLIF